MYVIIYQKCMFFGKSRSIQTTLWMLYANTQSGIFLHVSIGNIYDAFWCRALTSIYGEIRKYLVQHQFRQNGSAARISWHAKTFSVQFGNSLFLLGSYLIANLFYLVSQANYRRIFLHEVASGPTLTSLMNPFHYTERAGVKHFIGRQANLTPNWDLPPNFAFGWTKRIETQHYKREGSLCGPIITKSCSLCL